MSMHRPHWRWAFEELHDRLEEGCANPEAVATGHAKDPEDFIDLCQAMERELEAEKAFKEKWGE